MRDDEWLAESAGQIVGDHEHPPRLGIGAVDSTDDCGTHTECVPIVLSSRAAFSLLTSRHDATPSTMKEMRARIAAMLKSLEAMLPEDTPARLARDRYVQEQIEIASYELLWRIAGRAGDTETADVSRRILQNERETAEKIAGMWGHAAELSMKAHTAA